MTGFWDFAPYSLVATDVSEALAASIIRAITRPHGTSQKTVVFILVTVRM
jgi:hypothetical protein